MDKEIPKWLKIMVQAARNLLGIGGVEWHITVSLTPSPNGDHNNDGAARTDWIYRNAEIDLSCYMEETERTWGVVLHEVMHVSHAGVDYTVGSLLGQIPEEDQEYFKTLYQEAVEQYIQVASRNLAAYIPFDALLKDGEDDFTTTDLAHLKRGR